MRFLFQQGFTDPSVLLNMATVNGAAALGVNPSLLTLERGSVAGLLLMVSQAESTFEQVMQSNDKPTWLLPLLS